MNNCYNEQNWPVSSLLPITVKLGYNDHGYNKLTAITNKYGRSRDVGYNRVQLYMCWTKISFAAIRFLLMNGYF